MPPEDRERLQHMLDHAREAMALLADMDREAFREARTEQLALARLFEIMGEAANRISRPTQIAHDRIPWRVIVAMRNRLIHGYESIDLALLWLTTRRDLPPLIEQLEAALAGDALP